MSRFCLDTDVLIDASNLYPKDVLTRFWQTLEERGAEGRVFSPKEVLEELLRVEDEDEAAQWARQHKAFFRPPEESVQQAVKEVLKRFPHLVPVDASTPFADPWVVGEAMAGNAAVVTKERFTLPPKRPRIPNVCQEMGVCCIRLLDVLRFMNLGY